MVETMKVYVHCCARLTSPQSLGSASRTGFMIMYEAMSTKMNEKETKAPLISDGSIWVSLVKKLSFLSMIGRV